MTPLHRNVACRVSDADAGVALLAFLTRRFTYHSEDGWRGRIADGRLRVDGRQCDAGHTLRPGMLLTYDASDIPEPGADLHLPVLHDDAGILAINKPGNLPCHPGGRYFNHTLWALAKTRLGIHAPVIINRLDRETSGLCLIGRDAGAGQFCRAQFARHAVRKRYQVIVEGEFPQTLHAAGFLTADTASPVRKKRRFIPAWQGPGPATESAETHFRRTAFHNGLSFLEAEPVTGRTHQIRATLCSLGFPVVGDKLYGIDDTCFIRFCQDALTAGDHARLRLPRQALHAAYLQLHLPGSRGPVALAAPLPPDMQRLWNAPAP